MDRKPLRGARGGGGFLTGDPVGHTVRHLLCTPARDA